MNGAIKFLLGVVIIIGLGMGAYQLWEYWGKFQQPDSSSHATASTAPEVADTSLPGMSPKLEPILASSRNRGAAGLHDFLLTYGKTISDPRLASIELDYVVLVAKDDTTEARRVFAKVKSRTSPTSPVYPRVQMLQKTYD
ncbi:MAG: hypothetical protein ACXWKG_10450 [Limisphaerales bacterium]